MTISDAIWFRQQILPIIREAADERGSGPDPLRSMLREALDYADAIDELLRDAARCGVELDDARLRYITVQIDRPTWEALQQWREGVS